ncbi:hypothetical protein [Haloferula sp. A504]|uniref:hypothetical protein n=1 Tax=Haloferula sp. A504 TaxID=3373601 RepID=UPI0031C1E4EC|nr:hypothetical protein [Verrucomicrobiaceae bacterium E54]
MDAEENFASSQDTTPRKRSLLAFWLLGLATIAVLWAVSIGWLLIQSPEAPPAGPRSPVVEAPAGPEAIAMAEAAWNAFVEAEDLRQRQALVLNPEQVAPMMEDYHEVRGHPWPTMSTRSPGREIQRNGLPVVVLEVEDFGGRVYPVAIGWDGRRYAVDWESLTAYGTMDWAQLLERRPQARQTLRLYLGRLPEELQPPPSIAAGHTFIRMEHRDSPTTAPLAVPPQLVHGILPMIEGRRVPCTIEVAWNPDLQAFVLQRLVRQGWSSAF